MSTLAKNVFQVVLYENQVSDFVALLWMQTPLGHWITMFKSGHFLRTTILVCHGSDPQCSIHKKQEVHHPAVTVNPLYLVFPYI